MGYERNIRGMIVSDETQVQQDRTTGKPTVDPRTIVRDAELDAMIEKSPLASCITDPSLPDNPIVAVNDAFMSLTGFGEDEILGRNCRFLAGPKTEPWLTEAIREGVRERRPILVEILNYKKDGTAFRNAVMVAPIFDDDGELAHFLGTQMELEEDGRGPSLTSRVRASEMVGQLSPRQLQVMRGVAQGLRNKQIAYELGLAEKTVKMHRGIAMEKLGLRSSAELVRIAVEAGL